MPLWLVTIMKINPAYFSDNGVGYDLKNLQEKSFQDLKDGKIIFDVNTVLADTNKIISFNFISNGENVNEKGVRLAEDLTIELEHDCAYVKIGVIHESLGKVISEEHLTDTIFSKKLA